jgi:hypothetical protein
MKFTELQKLPFVIATVALATWTTCYCTKERSSIQAA